MYLQHFQLSSEPFSIAPDPSFLFLSNLHEEALAHLLFGLREGGGFVSLTGEVGTGKTTLCHCLMDQLPDNVDLALVLNPKLSSLELIATICDELGLDYPKQTTSIKVLTDVLNTHLLESHAQGRRTVLLIDEAQNLSHDVLEQIRLLTNLETRQTKLLQIILVGQPELNTLLNCKELRQLSQRITGRFHLDPLDFYQTRDYIKHRISKVNGRPDLFSSQAIRTVFKRSKGIPRLINTIADRSLLGAFSKNMQQVNTRLVTQAANEILDAGKQFPWRTAMTALVLGAVLMLTGVLLWFNREDTTVPENQVSAVEHTQPVRTSKTIKPDKPPETGSKPVQGKSESNPVALSDVLLNHDLSLQNAFLKLLSLYDLSVDEKQIEDPCRAIKPQGYGCLIDKANWRQIIKLNRPAILELEGANGDTHHLVFRQFKDNKVELDLSGEHRIKTDLNQLMPFWNGHVVQLWKIPGTGKYVLRNGDQNENVIKLRKLLHLADKQSPIAIQPNVFDNELEQRVARFQGQNGLVADGIVGPKTWILLNQYSSYQHPQLITSGQ
ncbi:MAG: AAA family ATPase [Gammaproteobacteria bacterium]|nr:AAA family ATPase [Gammaproteobacteria bacterium]